MEIDEYIKLAEYEDRMWYFRSLHRHVRRAVEHSVPGGRPYSLLDAGCGTGGLLLRLRAARPEARYSGIDFMPLACELTRKRCGPEVDVRVASITALPYDDASFDVLVSTDVLCQVDDRGLAMREFFRVLRPGGLLVVNAPAYMWMWSYHDDACQSKRRFTRPEIAGLMTEAGFADRRVTHWNALPFPLVWARRKLFHSEKDTSDIKLQPAPVEAFFNGVMAVEHAWLRLGGAWAWGTSVFGVARKP